MSIPESTSSCSIASNPGCFVQNGTLANASRDYNLRSPRGFIDSCPNNPQLVFLLARTTHFSHLNWVVWAKMAQPLNKMRLGFWEAPTIPPHSPVDRRTFPRRREIRIWAPRTVRPELARSKGRALSRTRQATRNPETS